MKLIRLVPLATLVWGAIPLQAADPASEWSPQSAATYLDSRMDWWTGWKTSQRDHETFCISCHTALPYAISRSALGASPVEQKVVDNVTKRVMLWGEVEPFYPDRGDDPKTKESRGTESILNALILANRDAHNGALSDVTRIALTNMWSEQILTGPEAGSFAWLQFHNAPWEGDSQYMGSTFAALAVGLVPGKYKSAPEIQDKIKLLRAYLGRERGSQKLIDRMMLLWASVKLPGILTVAEQKAIVDEALAKQQADGGFSLSQFVGDWKRKDNTALEAASDGYATGVVAFVLQETGIKRDQPKLKKALEWLEKNQQADGRWLAYSLNKQRDLATDVGKFMSDAATAYGVLALTH